MLGFVVLACGGEKKDIQGLVVGSPWAFVCLCFWFVWFRVLMPAHLSAEQDAFVGKHSIDWSVRISTMLPCFRSSHMLDWVAMDIHDGMRHGFQMHLSDVWISEFPVSGAHMLFACTLIIECSLSYVLLVGSLHTPGRSTQLMTILHNFKPLGDALQGVEVTARKLRLDGRHQPREVAGRTPIVHHHAPSRSKPSHAAPGNSFCAAYKGYEVQWGSWGTTAMGPTWTLAL